MPTIGSDLAKLKSAAKLVEAHDRATKISLAAEGRVKDMYKPRKKKKSAPSYESTQRSRAEYEDPEDHRD